MARNTKTIPVNSMADEFGEGIAIERISFKDLDALGIDQEKQTHRHDGHSFFLLEHGTVALEVDFERYEIKPLSVIYIHPDQVHRTIASHDVTVCAWSINNENLNPEYLRLLEGIVPARPLVLQQETFALMLEAVLLSLKFAERKSDRLYRSLLRDSCNGLIALVISQYLEQSKPVHKLSRFEVVSKAFKEILERNYIKLKRPAAFAEMLNLSTPYLNECVRNATGYPVSHHIQQRVILEVKRLLVHTDQSVKEIASELGYDDYPYFSRMFTKITGMTPSVFRNKNFD